MSRDIIISIAGCIVALALLFIFIPKTKIREAALVYLFKLLITYVLGILVVEFGLIEYPVRFFPDAIKTCFAFECVVYPSLCAIFNINFPEHKNVFGKFMHYFYFCTSITVVEAIVEKYTSIITYLHWAWYLSWITLFITFFISRQFYLWFFRLKIKTNPTIN